MSCYHHFTIEERSCLRKYHVEGKSYREIAKLLGRNVSSVSRELRRNYSHMYDIPTYYPHTAHKKYLFRRSFCHRGMFGNEKLIEYITEKSQATWLPNKLQICLANKKILSIKSYIVGCMKATLQKAI